MIRLINEHNILSADNARQVHMDGQNKVIIYEKNHLLFIFNFSTGNSVFGYQFRALEPGRYRIILNSDDIEFGGFGRVDNSVGYPTDGDQKVSIYLTNRTVLVMKKEG
jgi:1,4-alpha-glucan branching enzyme